ncbi:hypothetical protein BDV10DRAFT_157953 [Aspergillus recurvatus]
MPIPIVSSLALRVLMGLPADDRGGPSKTSHYGEHYSRLMFARPAIILLQCLETALTHNKGSRTLSSQDRNPEPSLSKSSNRDIVDNSTIGPICRRSLHMPAALFFCGLWSIYQLAEPFIPRDDCSEFVNHWTCKTCLVSLSSLTENSSALSLGQASLL